MEIGLPESTPTTDTPRATSDRPILERIPRLPQRQDSLADQLRDLQAVADRLGLYDAADWLDAKKIAVGPIYERPEFHASPED